MITSKLDDRKRLVLPQGKPGLVVSIEDNGDGSFTVTPVKPDVKEPFPPGCQAMKDAAKRLNDEWGDVTITVPSEELPD